MGKSLANIVLAYHGFVDASAPSLTFREHVHDFEGQVRYLERNGYAFVTPEQYLAWQQGTWTPATPIALLVIDDGLQSIQLVTPWLTENKIPFGLAIIGRRRRLRLPEEGYASWAQLSATVAGGYAHLMNHTYNLHNLCLTNEGNGLISAPILEHPCWVDDGDVVYRAAGDTRYYWDYSLVDGATWGFPIFGSDPGDNFTTPITASMTIDLPTAQTVSVLRLFLALGVPSGAGYAAHVQVSVDGTQVADTVIQPKDYGTRTQWVEREFESIPITATALTAGSHTITFTTLNTGHGAARLYAIPDFTGGFSLTTSATSVVPGKTGPDYADFPAGASWPARPGLILGTGAGADVSEAAYETYVAADMTAENNVIRTLLDATWTKHANPYNASSSTLFGVVAYGTYKDGTLADTVLRYRPDATFTAKTMRFRWDNQYGDKYAAVVDLQVGTSPTGPWTSVARIAPNWTSYHWQEFNLSTTYDFTSGTDYWVRLQTMNVSPRGEGLMRVYLDQRVPPRPTFYPVYRNWVLPDGYGFPAWALGIAVPIPSTFAIPQTGPNWYEVTEADHSDIWPTALVFSTTGDWSWTFGDLNGDGIPFVDAWSEVDGNSATPTQIVYPFGSFASTGTGTAYIHQTEDITAGLKSVFTAAGLDAGYTIWPNRNRVTGTEEVPGNRFTKWTMGRMMLYGSVAPQVTLSSLAAYTGLMWEDAQNGGVRWQTSLEPDPAGNATIKWARQALDYVSFDAYYFQLDGTIQPGRLNDGGTYTDLTNRLGSFVAGETVTGGTSAATAVVVWATNDSDHDVLSLSGVAGTFISGETVTGGTSAATASIASPGLDAYADDKTYLRSRGVRSLLILSNYSWALNNMDPAIASYVVNNPSSTVTPVGDLCVANGWDGAMLDLESVPEADRVAATDWVTQVAQDLHSRGLLCHVAVPASTGTSYDDPAWVGWCDHGELIRQVDAMQVMTYTESGPFSGPAPHAPDWFFTAVYQRLNVLVDLPFRPRILVGVNDYGHEWQAGSSGATYVSYQTALGDAFWAAALITNSNHEGTWSAGGTTAYFGTAQTIQRAVDMAASQGYGGIGVWKADDGDLNKEWPPNPWLGRRNYDPGYKEATLEDGLMLGATGGPLFSTQVVTMPSGREARSPTAPARVVYDLSGYLLLPAQRDALLALFWSHRGRLLSFRVRDPQDWRLQQEPLGTADGVQRAWPVVKTYTVGSVSVQRPITLLRAATVIVYTDGVVQAPAVDARLGWVSFALPPAKGAVITIDAEYDLRARFDVDALSLELEASTDYHRLGTTWVREVIS